MGMLKPARRNIAVPTMAVPVEQFRARRVFSKVKLAKSVKPQ
jgi:hypothetical protein